MSSTQRQVSSWVISPPNSVPAAPPRPFIAPHSPIARWRAGPAGKAEVMMASDGRGHQRAAEALQRRGRR